MKDHRLEWQKGMTHEQVARVDRLLDSQYIAGLQIGWNLGFCNDNRGFRQCMERHGSHLAEIEAARQRDFAEMAEQPGQGSEGGVS